MPGLLWPIDGFSTSQRFMGRDSREPTLFVARDAVGGRRARFAKFGDAQQLEHVHGAIDISCDLKTKVFAPESGKIVFADRYLNGENVIKLQIQPGTILFFTHLFVGDLERFRRKKGRHVRRGQVIALTGNSGPPGMTTGPHLHWEVRISTKPDAKVGRSGNWFKWNPRRLKVGGDLAGLRAILPLDNLLEPEVDEDEELEFATKEVEETMGPRDELAGPEEDLGAAPFAGTFDAEPDPADDAPDDDGEDEFGDFAVVPDDVRVRFGQG